MNQGMQRLTRSLSSNINYSWVFFYLWLAWVLFQLHSVWLEECLYPPYKCINYTDKLRSFLGEIQGHPRKHSLISISMTWQIPKTLFTCVSSIVRFAIIIFTPFFSPVFFYYSFLDVTKQHDIFELIGFHLECCDYLIFVEHLQWQVIGPPDLVGQLTWWYFGGINTMSGFEKEALHFWCLVLYDQSNCQVIS